MTAWRNEVGYAVGTLTRVPVPPPALLDRAVAGRGLAMAPIVGAAVGLLSGLPLLFSQADTLGRLMSATVVVALAAWLTRALHWDGLADLADGLGSRRPAPEALDVMRRSDIGPFGVLVVLTTASLQVLGLARVPSGTTSLGVWVLTLATARLALAAGASQWVHPARPDGLGALVIGAVTRTRLALAAVLAVVVGGVQAASGYVPWSVALLWAPVASLVVAAVVAVVAARRLGGSTGDVLGATTEIATATVLVLLTWH